MDGGDWRPEDKEIVTLIGWIVTADSGDLEAGLARGISQLGDVAQQSIWSVRRPFGAMSVVSHHADDSGYSANFDDWYCICDARIDNLDELAKRSDFETSTPSASACLLAAYRAHGERAWSMVEGDFACAIWHPPTRHLVLARDIVGARALYWTERSGGLIFGSELRVVAAVRAATLKLDTSQVVRQLSPVAYGAMELDRTLFEGIRRVAPGTRISDRGGARSVRRYWCPSQIPQVPPKDLHEAAAALRAKILDATLKCAATDAQVGCHLSGGLDCSSIAAMLYSNRIGSGPVPYFFSWTPRAEVDASSSELQRIDALIAMHGMAIEYVDASKAEEIRKNTEAGPSRALYPDTAMFMEQYVQHRASQLGVRRMLSGWGGDEAASHYGFGIWPELFFDGRWIRLFRMLALHEGRMSRSRLRRHGMDFVRGVYASISKHCGRFAPQGIASAGLQAQHRFRPLIEPNFALTVREAQISGYYSGHLTDRIESWYCHGKRAGIEYAYPLLHRRVLEFVYSMPGWCFADEHGTRRVFRAAVSPYWPKGLAERTRKDETGLGGFLMKGQSLGEAVKQRNVGGLALGEVARGGLMSMLVDSSRLSAMIKSVSEGNRASDCVVLSQADSLAATVMDIDKMMPVADDGFSSQE